MLSKLKNLWASWGTKGLKVPHAYDAATKLPSARLLWAYVAFVLATISVIALHARPQLLIATWTSIAFFVICTALFMLKNLHSFKADLDDQSVELTSEAEESAVKDEEKEEKPAKKDE